MSLLNATGISTDSTPPSDSDPSELRGLHRQPFQRQELEQQTRPGERAAAIAAGSVLALLGFCRRGVSGALVAGVGGALIYHGLAKRLLPQQRS